MKTAIVFTEGIKQINFTPENEDEKMVLKLITVNDDIHLAKKTGVFGPDSIKPFSVSIESCRGNHLRCFDNTESIMLVLTPKEKNIETFAPAAQFADEFTNNYLSMVDTLLSDDYKTGFKEGIEKYIESAHLEKK